MFNDSEKVPLVKESSVKEFFFKKLKNIWIFSFIIYHERFLCEFDILFRYLLEVMIFTFFKKIFIPFRWYYFINSRIIFYHNPCVSWTSYEDFFLFIKRDITVYEIFEGESLIRSSLYCVETFSYFGYKFYYSFQ